MKDILTQAANIASSGKSVLIIGEYGSGKSWLAKRIHQLGSRRSKPFISINCHIFQGHEVFTKIFGRLTYTMYGIRIDRSIFEQSQGGTIFFEGFDSLPEQAQHRIAETLESSWIRRPGCKQIIKIDRPRIISSVDVTSYQTVHNSRFLTGTAMNDDPYIITLPPLRQRREDIVPLMQAFFNQEANVFPGVTATGISPGALYRCIKYDWPGNIKQLKNAVEHAIIMSGKENIQPEDLPASVQTEDKTTDLPDQTIAGRSYKEAEKQLIKNVLAKAGFSEDAATLLGISKGIFSAKINEFGLLPKHRCR